jgi:two-component system NtrC family sensor kinase
VTGPSLTILLVDDEPLVRRSVRRALRGHDVVEAASGAEALDLIAAQRFDGILCDLLMPNMTGLEFYRRLDAEHPEQCSRLVIMSGSPSQGQRHLPAHVRVLEKPLEPQVLRDVVSSWQARSC